MEYQQRCIESKLIDFISFFSVVGVIGPRQSGKSMMLRENLSGYQYVNLDDAVMRNRFYSDPKAFMKTYGGKVIFDEAQKVPEIFDEIKLLVDEDRNTPGKFILCGSSHFLLMKSISESLAGRIGILKVLPFSIREMPQALIKESVFSGGYPELVNKAYRMKDAWFSAYVDTYLTRDVRDFGRITQLHEFQKLISALAANTAQQLNYSEYANNIGVDVNTIKRWVGILEASFVIYLLPPYFANLGKRLVKSPKVYFYDTGLVSFLTGTQTYNQYDKGPMAGSIFENYILMETLKKEYVEQTDAKLYYLRTSGGDEIDIILDRKTHLELIEVKKSETFNPRMLQHLKTYKREQDKATLVYSGDTLESDADINIVNYQEYF